MTISQINRSCTIIQRTADTANTYGDLVKTETQTAALCELQPISVGRGEIEGGNLTETLFNLYLDGLVALNADDAIIIDSETYELVGDAAPRRDPTFGVVLYTKCVVKRLRDG